MQRIQELLELKKLYLERMLGSVYVDLEPIKATTCHADSLEELAHTITKCHLCALSKSKGMPNVGYTPKFPKVAFILDTPITTSSHSPILTTRSGEMLQDMIDHVLKLSVKETSFLSVLKCQPPLASKEPQAEHIDSCLPYLFNQLLALKPQLIVPLGELPTQVFFKINDDFSNIRGKLQTWEGIPLIALYSPRHLLRNPSLKKTTMRDLIFIKSLIARNSNASQNHHSHSMPMSSHAPRQE